MIRAHVTMFKLIILATVLALAASEENDWFKGRWLQAVDYGSWVEIPCEWLELSLYPKTLFGVCEDKTIPLEVLFLLRQKPRRAIATIMFEGMDGLKETLEQKCKYHSGYEESPVVFRKINENYMVVYEKHHFKGPEPNQALLLVKEVPKLSELRKVMSEIEDLSNRTHTINCEPNYFVKED